MAFLSWWYIAGWQRQGILISRQLSRFLDTFSFKLLIGSLFSPFRQISAGSVDGSFSVQAQAWFDRTISRFIGAIVRTVMMITGLIVITFVLLIGAIRIALWPMLPVLPFIFFGVWIAGWLIWK